MIPLLKDPSFLVRTLVAESLGELRDKRAIDPLRSLLKDNEAGVRQSAITALVQMADPEIRSRLIPMLKDPDRPVRQSAAKILKEDSSPDVALTLSEYLAGEEELKKQAELEKSKIQVEREQRLADREAGRGESKTRE